MFFTLSIHFSKVTMESQIQHRFLDSDLDFHCFPMSLKGDTRHTKKGKAQELQ